MKSRSASTGRIKLIQDVSLPQTFTQPAGSRKLWSRRFSLRINRQRHAPVRQDAVFPSAEQAEMLESIRHRLRKRTR